MTTNLAAQMHAWVKGLLPELMGIEFTDVTPDKVVAHMSVHKGRTTVVCQTTVRSEAGKLVALVTQAQLVIAA